MPFINGDEGGGDLPLTGGTLTGPLTLRGTSGGAAVRLLDLLDTSDADAEVSVTFNTTVAGSDSVTLGLAAGHDGVANFAASDDNFSGSASLGSDGALLLTSRNGKSVQVTGDGPKLNILTSGALPTVALASGVGSQLSATRDVDSVTPVTFNPGAATIATCTVALSPDNVTYTTFGVETEPAGVAFDGTIHLVTVHVPAGWYLRLTVNAQAVLGTTTYY